MSRGDFIYLFLLFVTSVSCNADESWLIYQSDVLNSNREELVIKGVESQEDFNLPYKIEKWRGLSLGPAFYSVGISGNGIVVLKSTLNDTKNGFTISTYKLDLDNEPSDIALHHNRINGTSQPVIIVSYANDSSIDWFIVNEVIPSKFWTWKLDHPVLHINTFKIKGKDILLHLQEERDDTTVTLYEFDLRDRKPKRRFLDSLEILEPALSSALNAFNGVHYLSIPQTRSNLVLVFRHRDHRFEPYRNLRANGVRNVAPFRISVKSYLAVDGLDAGIFWFGEEKIVRQKVINSNLDGISYWLPVPLETYREDVVLLTERSLDHGTHQASTVEVITNNGGKFEEHVDVPCSHFGQHVNSLECMIRDSNLAGSSYISIGETVGVLLPRRESGLELFLISYEIRTLPHPKQKNINSMVEQMGSLQKLIQDQLDEHDNLKLLMEDITNSSTAPIVAASNDLPGIEAKVEEIGSQIEELRGKIDELMEEERDLNGHTVIINGTVEFRGGVKAKKVEVEEIDGQNATSLLGDIVGKLQTKPISGVKTFSNLTVDQLNFTVANGVGMEELVEKNETITLTGNIIFTKPVEAENAFGDGIDLTNIVDTRNFYDGKLVFEEIEVSDNFEAGTINGQNGNYDSLVFPENVSVTFVNGENFTKFARELCFTNLKCHIPGNVTVLGNITAEKVESQYLNNLRFPEEYILNDNVSHANITGAKFFKKLIAKEIRTTGTVSGVDTDSLFTLSTDQSIEGTMTFDDLELTEELNVTGKIIGKKIEKFLRNPSLKDTTEVKANVNFGELEVEGKIIVENNFNGQDLEELLSSIVYKDEEHVEIHATKEFPLGLTVKDDLEIESKSINSVQMDSLVTKDSEQDLSISILNGDVTIKNLIVSGRFAGRNITELDENLVKLTGDQFISSTLIFGEDLRVDKLEVVEEINGLEADQYVRIDEDSELDRSVRFQNISVENLFIQGDLNGEISGVDWNQIEEYMSYTKNQSIDADYEIKSAQIDQLKAKRINGVDFDKLFSLEKILRGLWPRFHNGSVTVEDLVVGGNLKVDKINNNTVNELFHKNPFEEDPANKTLTLEGDIYCDAIDIDKLNSVGWKYFLDQLIFKNDTNIVILGPKIFSSNFTVEKVIETKRLNSILLQNILRKEGEQKVHGPISIKGDVEFESLNVAGNINKINLETLLHRLQVQDEGFVINGDILFERLFYIQELVVDGTINNKDPTEALFDIAFLDESVKITGPVTFKGPVGIEKNLDVSHLTNNVDFTSVVSNIARTTEAVGISGMVSFSEEVIIFNEFMVEENMLTGTLFQYNTTQWLKKAVFLNRGFLKGNYTFENITINNKLTTKYINDHDMDYVVPLKTDQVIEYLEFKELVPINDIEVGNSVNGFDLEEEFSNTVMADMEQEISSDLIFKNNVLIYDTIKVETINDKNASEIITINSSDQNITASLLFEKCDFASHLDLQGLINGINVTEWDENLKVFSPNLQNVHQITVAGNLTFVDDVRGDALIEGLDIPSIVEEINERRDYKYQHELDTIHNYNATCTDIKYLYRQSKKQMYKFKYFETFQDLIFHDDIQHVFFLELGTKQYLLVNEPNCKSQLMVFNGTHFEVSLRDVRTGDVSQVVKVLDGDAIYLVIRGGTNKCDVKGTNIWKFGPNSLELRDKMEDQDLLQESLVPNTFYGLGAEGVVEYKIYPFGYRKYRRWEVPMDGTVDFIPRGFNTGLALTSSDKIIFLNRTEPSNDNYFDESSDTVIQATFTEVRTKHVFGARNDTTAVLNIGKGEARRKVFAIAVINPVKEVFDGQGDAIKIYEDVTEGRVFYQINTYKPSSIVSLEFSQAETLLIFMRDQTTLEVYEYKGIEKFKHKTSAKIPAREIIPMLLPTPGDINARRAIGLVHQNKIRIFDAKTLGNRIEEDFDCGL